MKKEGREKIGYPFVAFPKALCRPDYFHSPQLLTFLLWVFSRLSYGKRERLIHGQCISLDEDEFVFGRRVCSEETGLSEQTIRTHLKKLISSKSLQKVTSKSTNKFTVYRLIRERFCDLADRQSNQQLTSTQPAANHNQDIEIEEKQQQTHLAAAASFLLKGKAINKFDQLPSNEREAIINLYHQRIKTHPITNPEAWILKCITEGWHLESKFELPEPKIELSDYEKNKAYAKKLIEQFGNNHKLHICLRTDFLELGQSRHQPWQIFFSEASKAFLTKIDFALKKILI